jgi:hypothetical protein
MEKVAEAGAHPTPHFANQCPASSISTQRQISPSSQFLVFAAILLATVALHSPLLRLPYIWDEAGYYVPAARDLFLSGSLIPHSTASNAHPPLVMAWLAACWKVAGFRPVVTRVAMLVIAAFTLMGLFQLAAVVANVEVAAASTVCTALYAVFFTQGSLAHLDMAAAGLTFWGLRNYLQRRHWATWTWFALAALAKETAIVAPLALAAWEIALRLMRRPAVLETGEEHWRFEPVLLAAAVFPLGTWFAYHYARTGYVFGNPEFFRYNVTATLHPLRIVLAAAMRIWQLAGYMNLWLLTIAGALAMLLPPQRDSRGERPRITLSVQAVFLVLIVSYVLAMAMVGGAVLARYMLPVLPLIIILWVSTLWRRVQYWRLVIAIVCAAFVAGWFANPPYGFPFEDNLAYRDYILLHENAEQFLLKHHPAARVLTAWPASDELTRPYLGYVTAPIRVVQIDDFSLEQIALAAEARSRFEIALVFSTKYQPAHPLLRGWRAWEKIKEQFFGFHQDLPPAAVAQVLGGNVIYSATRNGQWISVIEIQHVLEAAETTVSLQMAKR